MIVFTVVGGCHREDTWSIFLEQRSYYIVMASFSRKANNKLFKYKSTVNRTLAPSALMSNSLDQQSYNKVDTGSEVASPLQETTNGSKSLRFAFEREERK